MIIDSKDFNLFDLLKGPVSVDLGRPTFYVDADFILWSEVFDFIETTPMTIAVNGVFYHMMELCSTKQHYGGGGFKFMFWFKNQEDADQFELETNKIFKKHSQARIDQYAEFRRIYMTQSNS